MKSFRLYGKAPYAVAVLHGGPGAAGEMAPVARELAKTTGVIEPLFNGTSVNAQLSQLKKILKSRASLPAVLVGYSWGAWLGIIFAAKYPELVGKLVLVSSGPLEEKYARGVMKTRLKRLNGKERNEVLKLLGTVSAKGRGKNAELRRFGSLMSKADSYSPVKEAASPANIRQDVFRKVWKEAAALRRSGGLLDLAAGLTCQVAAVHGSHDTHPARGVREPLSKVKKKIKFLLINKCGHTPWLEKHGKDRFYKIIKKEVEREGNYEKSDSIGAGFVRGAGGCGCSGGGGQ